MKKTGRREGSEMMCVTGEDNLVVMRTDDSRWDGVRTLGIDSGFRDGDRLLNLRAE